MSLHSTRAQRIISRIRLLPLAAQSNHNQGAALLIALLLTLALTAIGIVAIDSTVQGMRNAGNYRVRRQSQMASRSALGYVSNRIGSKAQVYWKNMDAQERSKRAAVGSKVGGYMVVDPETYTFTGQVPGETGLFSSENGAASHESKYAFSDFRVIVRDPIEGPPAVADNVFCYKKVMFASSVTYMTQGTSCSTQADCTVNGSFCNKPTVDTDGVCVQWDSSGFSARSSNSSEALIGPIACQ